MRRKLRIRYLRCIWRSVKRILVPSGHMDLAYFIAAMSAHLQGMARRLKRRKKLIVLLLDGVRCCSISYAKSISDLVERLVDPAAVVHSRHRHSRFLILRDYGDYSRSIAIQGSPQMTVAPEHG